MSRRLCTSVFVTRFVFHEEFDGEVHNIQWNIEYRLTFLYGAYEDCYDLATEVYTNSQKIGSGPAHEGRAMQDS